MHAYDRLLAARTAALSALVTLLALGIVVATDEPFSTAQMRVARLCAVAPAVGALSVALVIAQAGARGELRSLEALGTPPLRAALGALLGAWLLGAIATVLVVSPLADPAALLPRVAAPTEWLLDAGAFAAPAHGVRVDAEGALGLGAALGAPAPSVPPERLAAALAIGPLALVAPAWAATPLAWRWRLAAAGLAAALGVLLLHAVAAGRVAAPAVVLATLPLGLTVLAGLRRRTEP